MKPTKPPVGMFDTLDRLHEVRLKEREECAVIAERYDDGDNARRTANNIAEQIRKKI